jgi:hypothetical protein
MTDPIDPKPIRHPQDWYTRFGSLMDTNDRLLFSIFPAVWAHRVGTFVQNNPVVSGWRHSFKITELKDLLR